MLIKLIESVEWIEVCFFNKNMLTIKSFVYRIKTFCNNYITVGWNLVRFVPQKIINGIMMKSILIVTFDWILYKRRVLSNNLNRVQNFKNKIRLHIYLLCLPPFTMTYPFIFKLCLPWRNYKNKVNEIIKRT